jgi:hypothetical protein
MIFEKKEIDRLLDLLTDEREASKWLEGDAEIIAKLHTLRIQGDEAYVEGLRNPVQLTAEPVVMPAPTPRLDNWLFAGQLELGHFIILAEGVENHPQLGTKRASDINSGLRTSSVLSLEVDNGVLYAQTRNTKYQMGKPIDSIRSNWKTDFAKVFPILEPFLAT